MSGRLATSDVAGVVLSLLPHQAGKAVTECTWLLRSSTHVLCIALYTLWHRDLAGTWSPPYSFQGGPAMLVPCMGGPAMLVPCMGDTSLSRDHCQPKAAAHLSWNCATTFPAGARLPPSCSSSLLVGRPCAGRCCACSLRSSCPCTSSGMRLLASLSQIASSET